MFGLINLNKPSGISSRTAINRIQTLVRPAKTGHTGTLDPLASGVLVVTVGPATRLTDRVQQWNKTYRATFLLGRSSDTEDIEGQITELPNSVVPSMDQLQSSLPNFTGKIQQRPPAYSALKVKGQRAYQLARKGHSVSLEPRPVTIHDLRIECYEYPQLELRVECGGGTYIRSLGRDLARAVGTECVMSALTRTAVGHLTVDDSVRWEDIQRDDLAQRLLPPLEAVPQMPTLSLSEDEIKILSNGGELHCPERIEPELAALTPQGQLAAILARQNTSNRYRPQPNFVAAG